MPKLGFNSGILGVKMLVVSFNDKNFAPFKLICIVNQNKHEYSVSILFLNCFKNTHGISGIKRNYVNYYAYL